LAAREDPKSQTDTPDISKDQAVSMLIELLADGLAKRRIAREEFEQFKRSLPAIGFLAGSDALRIRIKAESREELLAAVKTWAAHCLIRDWIAPERYGELAGLCDRLG
jgi:hypothetical protein